MSRRHTLIALGAVVVAALSGGTRLRADNQLVASRWPLPEQVPARVVRVVDGDTIEVMAFVWVGQAIRTKVRLAGINAPERGSGDRADRATQRVQELTLNKDVVLEGVKNGKYAGRVVASVRLPDGRDLEDTLLAEGLADPYRPRR